MLGILVTTKDVINMVKSMTGYGKETIQIEQHILSIEMRSINHRFLDITMKMPRNLLFLEENFKKVIKHFFSRGKIEVFITISGQGNIRKNLQVDWDLLDQYMAHLNQIKKQHQLEGEIPASILVSLPDIFEVYEEEEMDDDLKEILQNVLKKACLELLAMRETEGAFLAKDILERLSRMRKLTNNLQQMRTTVIKEYQERIKERIKQHISDTAHLDMSRMHQEIAILAEKGDITEELIRLSSHIEQMKKTLKEEGSIGRKLDFICQEMHREANTIGSKSMDAEINQLDVLLKSEIEKVKEQVQNIE